MQQVRWLPPQTYLAPRDLALCADMPAPLGLLRARGLGADECGIFIDTAETSARLVPPDAKTKPDWFCLARKCFSYRVRVRKWTPGLQFTLTWPEPVQMQQLYGPLDQIVHLLTPGGGVVRSSGGDGFTPSEASPEIVFELTRPTTLVSSSFTMQGGGSIDVNPTVTCAAMLSAPAPPPRGLDCDLLPHYRVKNQWDAGLVAELRFERWEQDRLVTLQYPGADAVGMFDIKNAFPESSSTFSTSFQFRLRLGTAHPPDECAAECRKLALDGGIVTCAPYSEGACGGCVWHSRRTPWSLCHRLGLKPSATSLHTPASFANA